jgi:ribonuclease III
MTNLPKFKNQKLARLAFIHRSFLNESKGENESNERLEFLGDSVISFVVSNYLYKSYPMFNEGNLTNLRSLVVNTKSLAKIGKSLNFGEKLLLSKGEEDSGGRNNDSLLANTFEAYTGALFLDQGIEAVTQFLSQSLLPTVAEHVEKKVFKDPKSLLQERVQAKKLTSPEYRVLEEEGPAHAKKFTIGVYVENQLLGTGTGRSKQIAEEIAATAALEKKA